jgi:hypothetical protein
MVQNGGYANRNISLFPNREVGKHRGRIKHVNVSVHHMVQEIEDETIQLKFFRTSDMLADALTKSLVYKTLAFFASKMKGKKFRSEAPPTPRHTVS